MSASKPALEEDDTKNDSLVGVCVCFCGCCFTAVRVAAVIAKALDGDEAKSRAALACLNANEISTLTDVKKLTAKDLEECISEIKPPPRRAAVRAALLPFTGS